MADNYFDADAYLRAQNEDFSNAILGANQGGVSPLPDTSETPSAPTEPSLADRFRAAVLPPVSRAASVAVGASPMLRAAPGLLGAVGTVANETEQARPGTLNSIAPREQIKNHEQYGPSNAFKRPETGGPADTFSLYPVIKPAPTLKEQAAKALGAGAGFGGDMGGLLGKYRGAQQDQVDTMSHGADLQLELGQRKVDAQTQMADLRAAQAEQMRLDAERQQQIEADANARHEAFLAQSQKMADAISANNVDPSRFLRNADAKTQFIIGLGSAIGGANAAANGGPNQYLDRLDAIMDRDFKGQLANADNQRAALSARNTVFGQVMAQTQDRRLADMQARDLMYTAMKTKLLSDADRLGVPEIMTNARIAANEIENKQKQLQTQIAQQSYQSAVAAAQAARTAQERAEIRAYQMGQDAIKNNQEQQKIDIAAAAAGKTANKERDEAQTEVNANVSTIDKAQRDVKSISEGTTAGDIYGRVAPGWFPGASEARKNSATRDAYNVQVMMMVGAAYKLDTNANEPKNLEILKKYSAPYLVKTDDGDEVINKRMNDLRKLMLESGAAKGVAPPPPRASTYTPDAKGVQR